MQKLKIRQVGNSLGVVLPKEVLDRRGIAKDDELTMTETTDGIALTFFDADLDDAEAWIEKGAKRYKNTLRALAQ